MKWHTTIAVRACKRKIRQNYGCSMFMVLPVAYGIINADISLPVFKGKYQKYQWYSRVMWYCRGLDSGTSSSVQGGCVVCGARLGVAEKSG